MNILELTEIQRSQLTELFKEHKLPDTSAAIEKIQIIAYHWFAECRKCPAKCSKKIEKPLALSQEERALLQAAFKKAFNVDLTFSAPGFLTTLFESCTKKRGIKLLPKTAISALETCFIKATWELHNPHIHIAPLERSFPELLLQERLSNQAAPDVILKVGELGIPAHSFLLRAHASNIALTNEPLQIAAIEDVNLEALRFVLLAIYKEEIFLDEQAPVETVINVAKAAKKIGAKACLQAYEALLCKKAETDYEQVKAAASELELRDLEKYVAELKPIQQLPPLPFGADKYLE